MIIKVAFVLFFFIVVLLAAPLPATNLRVEYRGSPLLGLDVPKPRFAYELQSTERGSLQSAYQIIVSKVPTALVGDVWDSGMVKTSQSTQIEFNGKSLESDTSYYWKVKWWNDQAIASDWSPIARFDTGLFNRSDWAGQWIGGYNQLRHEFSLPGAISRARLFIVGLGYYDAYINGIRIGHPRSLGTFTNFQKRILYDTYDVTSILGSVNAIGVLLGNGWYAQPSVRVGPISLLAQINVELQSGARIIISTSTQWKGIQGPVLQDDIYIGETYDATLESEGWDLPGFDDSKWNSATLVKVPTGVLSSQLVQQVEQLDVYTPVSVSQPTDGVYVFDFGQNLAGYCRLKVSGPRGTKISLQHAEILYPDGNIHHLYPNSPEIDVYVLKGNGLEVWSPRFTYHGFRYVAVTGWPGVPDLDSLESIFVHTALPETGEIVFSNALLNQIQHITRFASLSNYMNIPTDCPQRERRGWLGDAQLSAETTIHNWDMSAAYTKFLTDINDEQIYDNSNGEVPDCVPWYDHGGIPADPAWGCAYTLIWHWMYEYYGDTRILAQHYTGVKNYIDGLTSITNKTTGLLTFSRYGDWCAVAANQGCAYASALVSSFYYLMQLEIFSDVATLLNNTADAIKYKNLATQVRTVWNANFYHPSTHTYEEGFQTKQILSLWENLVDSSQTSGVIAYLIDDIVNQHNSHLTTGIVGTKYLFPVLTRIGRTDLAYTIATQTTYPSYGWMLQGGATTLWESWQGDRYNAYGSRNHIMFGSQSDWYFKVLAGINQQPQTVGFSDIIFKPDIIGLQKTDLTNVAASIRTHRGLIFSSWTRNTGQGLCGIATEGTPLTLRCVGGTISKITFASYGLPEGTCGAFQINPQCNAKDSVTKVESACLGKTSCTVTADNTFFGGDPCYGQVKRLYVAVAGCDYSAFSHAVTVPVNSRASLYIPKLVTATDIVILESGSTVWSNGRFIPGVSGVRSGRDVGDSILFEIGSGSYHFELLGK